MEFIEQEKPDGCIFCRFPAEEGEAADRRNLIVHRSPRAFTILNRFPYNNGHVMTVPRAHVARLEDLEVGDFADLQDELRRAVAAIRAAYRPEGMNVGMNLGKVAGAGIADHLHWHVVPRWIGDNNFMPVIADQRVVPEALDAAWEKLRAGFQAGAP
jgi:ATP adenylyltransferase